MCAKSTTSSRGQLSPGYFSAFAYVTTGFQVLLQVFVGSLCKSHSVSKLGQVQPAGSQHLISGGVPQAGGRQCQAEREGQAALLWRLCLVYLGVDVNAQHLGTGIGL